MDSAVNAGVSGRYSSGVPAALSTRKTDSFECWCSSLVAIQDRFEEHQSVARRTGFAGPQTATLSKTVTSCFCVKNSESVTESRPTPNLKSRNARRAPFSSGSSVKAQLQRQL